MKRNFTPLEIIENEKFIITVYDFTNECLDYCNLFFNLDPESIHGLTYLIKFWTLFSTTIAGNNNFPLKEKYKLITNNIFERIVQKIVDSVSIININDITEKVSESVLNDLLLSISVLSKGMYIYS